VCGSGPRSARKKILRVLDRHPSVFQKLADLVRVGNDVVIVLGNHDVEFHWRIVQEAFKDHLAVLALGPAADAGGAAAQAFKERITFAPWFYYEPGVCYIEHGHQYDEFCSFDFQLCPIAPRSHEGILMSVGAASIRYLANIIPSIDPFTQEEWSGWGYMQWGFSQGLRTVVRLLYLWAFANWKIMAVWGQLREAVAEGRRRRQHEARVAEVARSSGLGIETAEALDGLHKRPVLKNLWKLLSALLLDRVAVATAGVVGVVLALLWAHGIWKLLLALACLGGAWLVNAVLARRREHDIDADLSLAQMPAKILNQVKAPYLVFGHTHAPRAVQLEGGGTYFNTGTWVAGQKPGLLRAFTHVMIRLDAADQPKATLCQWRNGGSQPFPVSP
jgi:hypothetical protein